MDITKTNPITLEKNDKGCIVKEGRSTDGSQSTCLPG
jgi:hypothetical protein